MPWNSPAGYQAAIVMRSNRTLLVEGGTDKGVIAHVLHELRERRQLNADDVVVDTAADIASGGGPRLGNRQKVEAVHALMPGANPKFAAFVDSEFRMFDLSVPTDLTNDHQVFNGNLFWTRGHSVENYLIDLAAIIRFLRQQFMEHLPADHEKLIADQLERLLRSSTLVCLAAFGAHLLDRIKELYHPAHWTVKASGELALNEAELANSLTTRGADSTELALFEAMLKYYKMRIQGLGLALTRRICRGHTAMAYVWSGISALLAHSGMPAVAAADLLSHRQQTTFFKIASQIWAVDCANEQAERPVALIDWLKG